MQLKILFNNQTIYSAFAGIPGTKHIKYLEENTTSEIVELTANDLKSIQAIMPAGIVSGTRYHKMFMNALSR